MGISAIPAVPYGDRFLTFIKEALHVADPTKYLSGNAGLSTFIPNLVTESAQHASLPRPDLDLETDTADTSREQTPISIDKHEASSLRLSVDQLGSSGIIGPELPSSQHVPGELPGEFRRRRRTTSSTGNRRSFNADKAAVIQN